MTEKELAPYVRFFRRNLSKIAYPRMVMAYDHRLFYVRRGNIELELEDRTVPMTAGGLAVLPPVTPYRLRFDGGAVDYIIINFDFDSAAGGARVRAPVCCEQFDESMVFSRTHIEPFGSPVFMTGAFFAEPLFDEMHKAGEIGESFCDERLSAMMKYILLTVVCGFLQNKGKDDPLITRACDFVDVHYAEGINNRDVAKAVGYHPYYLSKRFAEHMGGTLHEYIEQVRLKHAKRMLIESAVPIRDIAQACGFYDAAYFSKFFFKHTGMLPKDYRDFSH